MKNTISKILRSGAKIPLFRGLAEIARRNLWTMPRSVRRDWEQRIQDVLNAPETKLIPKHENAGEIVEGLLVMHNGIKIDPLSYYGYPMRKMFMLSGGIHEPQEELVFGKVLEKLPSSATMVELGSYWAFYSMWFHKAIEEPRCIMVEPEEEGLAFGRNNFRLNQMEGEFINAFVGAASEKPIDQTPTINIDELVESRKLDRINLLHSDIQGFELEMLEGAEMIFRRDAVDYCFISTHSNELHADCVQKLQDYGHEILFTIDLDDTYSHDGLIVSCRQGAARLDLAELSRRSKDHR